MQTEGFPLRRPRTTSDGERAGGPALRGRRRAGQTSTTKMDEMIKVLVFDDGGFEESPLTMMQTLQNHLRGRKTRK